ncbi:MAG: cytochrome c oxidase accessory protein CcoG, partial [Woeseiaceae bacterium]|nr:cytochrome c oxidase accessory protein CcoG [Woeseiaceae bacterium]
TLYRELPGDVIENIYTLKLINQSNEPRSFDLTVSGVEGVSLDGAPNPVEVGGGDVLSLPVRVRVHRDNAYGIMDIEFSITATDDPSVSIVEDSRFLGPSP